MSRFLVLSRRSFRFKREYIFPEEIVLSCRPALYFDRMRPSKKWKKNFQSYVQRVGVLEGIQLIQELIALPDNLAIHLTPHTIALHVTEGTAIDWIYTEEQICERIGNVFGSLRVSIYPVDNDQTTDVTIWQLPIGY